MNPLADYFPQTRRERMISAARTRAAMPKPCWRCNGSGEISSVGRGKRGGNAGTVQTVRCTVCKGMGAV